MDEWTIEVRRIRSGCGRWRSSVLGGCRRAGSSLDSKSDTRCDGGGGTAKNPKAKEQIGAGQQVETTDDDKMKELSI